MTIWRKRHQLAREFRHLEIQSFWMNKACAKQVRHSRNRRVDCVQEPEDGDLCRSEICKRSGALATLLAQTAALCNKNLNNLPQHVFQPVGGANAQCWRDVVFRNFQLSGRRALKLCDLDTAIALAHLVAEKNFKIAARQSYLLFVRAGRLVQDFRSILPEANHLVGRAAVRLKVRSARTLSGNRKVNFQTLCVRAEVAFDGARLWRRVCFGNRDGESVRKNGAAAYQIEIAVGYSFVVDLNIEHAPLVRRERR